MNLLTSQKIVILGSMSKMPVAGIVFITMQYLVGLKRLGYDVYYVEADGRTPSMLMQHEHEDSAALAATFIADTLRRFDIASDHWALHALHTDGRCYGLSRQQLDTLYEEAALIINLHGGTDPLPEHAQTDRLVYLGTDPVLREIEASQQKPETIKLLEAHRSFFTWGENYGHTDCGVPLLDRYAFKPTRQPILLDLWEPFHDGAAEHFTTIGNWRQPWRELEFRGQRYSWSKHHEFLKFIDLPTLTTQTFELALGSYEPEDVSVLERHQWKVRDAVAMSSDIDGYCRYIGESRGEFTVAKDQNVRLRSGWFSDRSACYLALGRPVVTQETGFSNILPIGAGLFAFSTMDEILDAIERINGDYEKHRRSALDLARAFFDYRIVLPQFLVEAELDGRRPGAPLPAAPEPVAAEPEPEVTPEPEPPVAVATEDTRDGVVPPQVPLPLPPLAANAGDDGRATRIRLVSARWRVWLTLLIITGVWLLRTNSRVSLVVFVLVSLAVLLLAHRGVKLVKQKD